MNKTKKTKRVFCFVRGTNLTAASHVIFLHPMLAPNADRAVGYEMQVDSSQIFTTGQLDLFDLVLEGFRFFEKWKNDRQIQQNINR